MFTCTKCGHTENRTKTNYCPSCGKANRKSMKMEYVCKDCGTSLAESEITQEDWGKYKAGNVRVEIPRCPKCK
jgi:rubrerythrin